MARAIVRQLGKQFTTSVVTPLAASGGFSAPGTGTYTTPSGVKYLRIYMIGGGAGGQGSGTTPVDPAGNGNQTVFGTSLLTASGGSRPVGANANGGTGGSGIINSPATGNIFSGGEGASGGALNAAGSRFVGGAGGEAPHFGGAGKNSVYSSAGSSGRFGAGGQGGGNNAINGVVSGAGGGAGGYLEAVITSPATSYTYTVGSVANGGTAGVSGFAGGQGGAGIIIVEEYY